MTSGCRRRTPTTACVPCCGSGRPDPRRRYWCSPSSCNAATPPSSSGTVPPAWATCSSSACSTSLSSAEAYAGSRTAAPQWTRGRHLMMTRTRRDDEALDWMTPRGREVLGTHRPGTHQRRDRPQARDLRQGGRRAHLRHLRRPRPCRPRRRAPPRARRHPLSGAMTADDRRSLPSRHSGVLSSRSERSWGRDQCCGALAGGRRSRPTSWVGG